MDLATFRTVPRRVLEVILAIRGAEKVAQEEGAAVTYRFLQDQLGLASPTAVYDRVLEARRLRYVEPARSAAGGRGRKQAFRLTDQGRALVTG